MRAALLQFLTLTLMCTLVSCAGNKAKQVAKFTLIHPSNITFLPKSSRSSVFVSRVVASPGFSSSQLIYTDKPYQVKKFSKNAWVAPPARLLHALLIESLRNSKLFVAVNTAPSTGISKYRLDTKLLTLQHEFLQKPSVVRAAIEISVVNTKTHHTIAQKRFHVVRAAKEDTPYAGVVSMNAVVRSLLSDVVKYLATLNLR